MEKSQISYALDALVLRQCTKIDHSGRSLFDHLTGTYNLLNSWGCDDTTKLAGLYHSVYGTSAFKDAIFCRQSERDCVCSIIGSSSEELVFRYSFLPKMWWEESDIIERVYSEKFFSQVVVVSLANVVEQSTRVVDCIPEARRLVALFPAIINPSLLGGKSNG